MHTRERPVRRRIFQTVPIAAVVVAAGIVGPAALLSSAAAATDSTTVTVSPNPSAFGSTVSVTAKIQVLGILASLPTNNVDFTDGSTALGSTPISCPGLLSPSCSATITTSALPLGTSTVTATYEGSIVLASTSGSTSATTYRTADPTHQSVTTCTSGPCNTGVLYADDASSDIDVNANSSASAYTITTYLGGPGLPCGTAGTGQVGNYTVSSSVSTNTITYQNLGSYADTFNNLYGATHHLCYEASISFAQQNGHSATKTGSGASTTYYGLLPDCTTAHGGTTPGNPPCLESQTFTAGSGGSQDVETWVVYEAYKQHCDPKLAP